MSFLRSSIVLALLALFGVSIGTSFGDGASSTASQTLKVADADRIVQELCGKSVAMVGESPLHGFGKTLEFKAALVPRLVDQCHFNAFFIESGIYDFLNIRKRLNSGQELAMN